MNADQQIIQDIKIDKIFFDFIDNEVCDGLEITATDFFESLSKILSELQESNQLLLDKRDELQSQIDEWHLQNKRIDPQKYKEFLQSIGYVAEKPDEFSIEVEEVKMSFVGQGVDLECR